eukprot:1141877-Pelagomonas_calceolata.AAC.2
MEGGNWDSGKSIQSVSSRFGKYMLPSSAFLEGVVIGVPGTHECTTQLHRPEADSLCCRFVVGMLAPGWDVAVH